MISDIRTVLWKETSEILRQGGSRGWLNLLLIVGVFGVFLPLQTGRAWVESPVTLLYWTWLPLFLVTGVIADSFAGERERHTLETLLASRLSDQAILIGKVCASVVYGWGLTLVSLMAGVVTVNVAAGGSEFLFYPPMVAAGILGISFLAAGLVAGVGVLVSLRAATVRQAAQGLSIAIMLVLFVPMFGVQALPREWQMRIFAATMTGGTARLMVVAMAMLVLLDAVVLTVAKARFRRSRLILD